MHYLINSISAFRCAKQNCTSSVCTVHESFFCFAHSFQFFIFLVINTAHTPSSRTLVWLLCNRNTHTHIRFSMELRLHRCEMPGERRSMPAVNTGSYVQCHICTVPHMYSASYVQCLICTVSHMYNVTYVQCHICTLPHMYTGSYVQCHVCTVPHMYSVTYRTWVLTRVLASPSRSSSLLIRASCRLVRSSSSSCKTRIKTTEPHTLTPGTLSGRVLTVNKRFLAQLLFCRSLDQQAETQGLPA